MKKIHIFIGAIILLIIELVLGGFFIFIFILFIVLLVRLLVVKRINDIFIYNRFTHNISQNPSIVVLIKLNTKNNFINSKTYSHMLKKTLWRCKVKAVKFFEKTKVKKFNTRTNENIVQQLDHFEKNGLIILVKIEEVKNKKVSVWSKIKNKIIKEENNQPIEKMLLFGVFTIIKNRNNKEFWDFINREEIVHKYEILANKKNS
ncbi:hypothetical protein [Clostridium akagii]|uniref:hypothetical protein n=1 Tax=Clostridium akagii TaxID=91623 RepID=UPI00047EA128|nr:hypothetical protein [Clostridium akagii]